jgi:hypothetical protein
MIKVIFLSRIGTCGGIGLPPGTVVVTDEAFDGLLRPVLDTVSSLFLFWSSKSWNFKETHLQIPFGKLDHPSSPVSTALPEFFVYSRKLLA